MPAKRKQLTQQDRAAAFAESNVSRKYTGTPSELQQADKDRETDMMYVRFGWYGGYAAALRDQRRRGDRGERGS